MPNAFIFYFIQLALKTFGRWKVKDSEEQQNKINFFFISEMTLK